MLFFHTIITGVVVWIFIRTLTLDLNKSINSSFITMFFMQKHKKIKNKQQKMFNFPDPSPSSPGLWSYPSKTLKKFLTSSRFFKRKLQPGLCSFEWYYVSKSRLGPRFDRNISVFSTTCCIKFDYYLAIFIFESLRALKN